MFYSKQICYCNNCGIQMKIEFHKLIGSSFKVCSLKCNEEIKLKDIKSNLGEEDKNEF